MPTFDDTDRDIIMRRAHKLLNRFSKAPAVGDFVEFSDGMFHRVSHVWDNGVQTSRGGSFYLSDGACDFSGGLDPIIPFEDLTLTDETRNGRIWIFHHDWATAHNGVDSEIPFRVYRANRPSAEHYCFDCGRMVDGVHWMGADGRHKRPQPTMPGRL